MGLCKNLIRKKECETRGKNGQVSEVELGYKDTHLSGKNGHVSDSRIRGTCCPLEKKETKKNDSPWSL